MKKPKTLPPQTATTSGTLEQTAIRDWLLGCKRAPDPSCASPIMTTGSGPFEEIEFDERLEAQGYRPVPLDDSTNILVVGRHDWSEEALDDLLDDREGGTLRVYSQEMFLLSLLIDRDPLKAGPEAIEAFRTGHPALEWLAEGWPGWVSTEVDRNADSEFDLEVEWPSVGLLSHVGYHVGASGLRSTARRSILKHVFEERLPYVSSPQYMAEWGAPRSGNRLRKLAQSLAYFCVLQKRRAKSSVAAIRDWEADLVWLEVTFYHGHFRFGWPSS